MCIVPGVQNTQLSVWYLEFYNLVDVYSTWSPEYSALCMVPGVLAVCFLFIVPGYLNNSISVWNLKFSNHLSVYLVPGDLILPALYGTWSSLIS